MSRWARWSRAVEPGALLRYVRPDLVAAVLPGLPEPSGAEPVVILRGIYGLVAAVRVRYQHEPAGGGTAGQRLRSPDEVLAQPTHGTCLDLVLVFAGACERAGLRSSIAIASTAGGVDHAFLVVKADPGGPVRSPSGVELSQPPEAMLDGDVRADPEAAGSLIALDVTLAARERPDGAEPAPFEAAVAAGARLVDDVLNGRRGWRVGVDVEAGFHMDRVQDPGPVPALEVLTAPYHPPVERVGPLAQLKARNGLMPFLGRGELDTLRVWCEAEPVGVAVVYGSGGSGKTHLAAELCRRLADEGWYAGFLSKLTGRADLEWLAAVVSPVLVVVDYAEDADPKLLARLVALLHTRPADSPGWVAVHRPGAYHRRLAGQP